MKKEDKNLIQMKKQKDYWRQKYRKLKNSQIKQGKTKLRMKQVIIPRQMPTSVSSSHNRLPDKPDCNIKDLEEKGK